MGIKGLMKLIDDEAAASYKVADPKNYMGRTIAVDASMQLYQFMSMVRSQNQNAQLLSNDAGEVTSHLLGFFHRTISLMEKGIKPIYVFDGKPPEMKKQELLKRREAKEKAAEEIKALEEKINEGRGDKETEEELARMQKRNLSVTKEHNAEVQKLLTLMGVPFILAPSEAEAQCSVLCKSGKVFAVATEDMDALTFATPILIRNLTYSAARKLDVLEIHLDKLLTQLELNYDQFVDLCILCGCDYAPTIKGIGPKGALKLVKQHKNIEVIFQHIDKEKYPVAEELENNIKQIREMFTSPEVTPAEEITDFIWQKPDEEGIIQYLVNEKQFDAERVKNALKRLENSKKQTSQKRMDAFFKPAESSDSASGFKRKKEQSKGKGVKKRR